MSEIYVRCDLRTYHIGFKSWAHTVLYWRVESTGFASDWDMLRSFHLMISNDGFIVEEWSYTMNFDCCIVSFQSYAIGKGVSDKTTWYVGSYTGQRFVPLVKYVVDSGQCRIHLLTDPFEPGHFVSIPWTFDNDWNAGGLDAFTRIYFRDHIAAALAPFHTYAGYYCTPQIRMSNGTFREIYDVRPFGKMRSLRTRRIKV